MFTVGAIALAALIGWYANRTNEKDRAGYEKAPDHLREWLLLLHVRQDLKLMAFLLAGILIMLGVIADRL